MNRNGRSPNSGAEGQTDLRSSDIAYGSECASLEAPLRSGLDAQLAAVIRLSDAVDFTA